MHENPENYGRGALPEGQGGYPPRPEIRPPYGAQAYPGTGEPPYGAQHPGQPSHPAQPSHPGQPYPGRPPNPGQGPYGGQQPYGAPPPVPGPGGAWGQGGAFGQPPVPGGWGPPPPGPPPKKSSGPVVVLAIVAVLVVLGGGGAIIWVVSGDGKPRHAAAAASSPAALPAPPSFPTTVPTPDDPLPDPTSTEDQSMLVQAGDCVRITGKPPDLSMLKMSCDTAPYKVLKRFSGTADRSKCRSVRGFTTVFYAKNTKYSFLSYVLCLKRQ